MRGTVVGINTLTLDVLFDSTIMSGSTLGGRCSEGRGGVVPKSSVLNLTNPTVVAYSQAGLQRKPEEDTSRTGSPVHATRSQFNRPGRGRGGNWYTPWAVKAPAPVKPQSVQPKPAAPFSPTVLLRQSQQAGPMQVPAGAATMHLYHNGVGIPPPANLDQRQRVRAPQYPRTMGTPPPSTQSPQRGGTPTGPRAGRGGRGGSRGGAVNGSPRGGAVNFSPGRGGYRARGRGSGFSPAPAQTQRSQ
jgi:5'-3' exoribonuclease 1